MKKLKPIQVKGEEKLKLHTCVVAARRGSMHGEAVELSKLTLRVKADLR